MSLPANFYLPPSAAIHDPGRERKPRFRCAVIVGDGEVCGHPFYEGEDMAYQRHVIQCAKAHQEEIRAASMRTKLPGFFGPESGIPDLEAWVREHRTELIEGRKKM